MGQILQKKNTDKKAILDVPHIQFNRMSIKKKNVASVPMKNIKRCASEAREPNRTNFTSAGQTGEVAAT